ncbi:GldG family protein [Treponema pedis]|uniref:Uncharacterized protein n=1 Tax=Treponema pedis str. T A4 TaxID=1291379 RepID=S5ZJX1_9SPIR|nr:GldG family protein [Treponema pedis]AGT42857.1 hypothetical protein TPE_0361 [Treponema pedis str. T A4]
MKLKQKKIYTIRFFLFCSALFLSVLISEKKYFRADTTPQKAYSLSEYTYELLDSLNATVSVTWFKTDGVENFFPSLKYLTDTVKEYAVYSNNKFIFTEKNTAELSEDAIKKIGLVPRQIEAQNDSSQTLYTLYSGLMLEYGGETRVIPFVDDIDILEYDIARLISDMQSIAAGNKTLKTVAVMVPPDTIDKEYGYVIPWLEYAGFNVQVLNLPIDNIPEDLPLLVIGSSYIDIGSAAAIDVFLQKHGRGVFFVSGNTVDIKGNWKAVPKVQDFLLNVLARHGFYIQSDLILDLVNFRITMSAVDSTGAKTVNYPFWIMLQHSTVEKNNAIFSGMFSGNKNLQTFWPSSVSVDEEKNKIKISASTTANSIKMIENYDTDPFSNQLSLFSVREKSAEAVVAEKIYPAPVVVISDEYMISRAVDYTGTSFNLDFMVNCIEHICGYDNLTLLKNKMHTALPFKQFDDKDEFVKAVTFARIISLIILPLIITFAAVYIFILQRKKK